MHAAAVHFMSWQRTLQTFLIELFEEDVYELDDKMCYKQWIHELIELAATFF